MPWGVSQVYSYPCPVLPLFSFLSILHLLSQDIYRTPKVVLVVDPRDFAVLQNLGMGQSSHFEVGELFLESLAAFIAYGHR